MLYIIIVHQATAIENVTVKKTLVGTDQLKNKQTDKKKNEFYMFNSQIWNF